MLSTVVYVCMSVLLLQLFFRVTTATYLPPSHPSPLSHQPFACDHQYQWKSHHLIIISIIVNIISSSSMHA